MDMIYRDDDKTMLDPMHGVSPEMSQATDNPPLINANPSGYHYNTRRASRGVDLLKN